MDIIPGPLNADGNREYEIILCKCDVLDLLMNFASFELSEEFPCSPIGEAEVYWAGAEGIPDGDHFTMARVKLCATPFDSGQLN